VEAVIFDLDDTLIVEEATARSAVAEALSTVEGVSATDPVDTTMACARRRWQGSICHEACLRLGLASWEGLWATFEGCHDSLAGLADWAPVYREAAWADALVALGADPAQSPEVAQRYIDAQRRGHPVIPCAIEAVRSVGMTARAGVLTNGPPDIQRFKLSQAGLNGVLDAVVISGETGFGKPEAAAFSLILDQLDARAADTVMVGDSWERDICGSLKAGMRTVWVSHGRQPPEQPDDVLIVDEITAAVFEAL
jgi:putative hydrolase of the HAD superfamily